MEAVRSSALLVQLARREEAVAAPQASLSTVAPDVADVAPPASAGSGNAQHMVAFASLEPGDMIAHALRPPPSPWTLSAGTIIPASLVTGLNSDLPGIVLAQVTRNVGDSATGRTVLIPQGSRLIGRYDSLIAYGQRRALLVWQRIVFPDGASVELDNMPATDLSGFAGVEDDVDFHTWRLIGGIALSTLLGVGTELSLGSGEGDLVRAIRESAQQNAAQAGDRITSRNLDVQPTLRVRPGWPVNAIVHKDLVLRPWRG
jgi:type IV secretion system protein VirB10